MATSKRITKRSVLVTARPDLSLDMPLARKRMTKGELGFFDGGRVVLRMNNLDAPIGWSIQLARNTVTKLSADDAAEQFAPQGSRDLAGMVDNELPAEPAALDEGPLAGIDGTTEFGLQTADDKEYFLSKFGDLVGILRVQRKGDGTWKAGLEKSNVPRVLSADAVANGLMPPPGHSGLPKSLEAVVPPEYQYWKAQGDEARAMRDALVEKAFFSDDCIKAIDGELRKVEVRYFLYEPGEAPAEAPKFKAPDLASRVADVLGEKAAKAFSPMSEGGDWLEELDKRAADASALAILSPGDDGTTPREMTRAVKGVACDYLLEHNDTRAARAAFSGAGVVFKLAGEPSRVFCASFVPYGIGGPVSLLKAAAVQTMEFGGIQLTIDRPKGYVQTGKDENGNEWSREYRTDYGFIPRTAGGDGEELDVFVGPSIDSDRVFWVTQNKADGSFDEYKLFLGYDTPAEAHAEYVAHIPPQFYGGMSELALGQLRGMLGLDPVATAKRLAATAVHKVNGVSFDEVRRAVSSALDDLYPRDTEAPCGVWIEDVYDDHAVYCYDGKYYQIGYTYSGGTATLSGNPAQVRRTYQPVDGEADAGIEAQGTAAPPVPMEMRRFKASKAVVRKETDHDARRASHAAHSASAQANANTSPKAHHDHSVAAYLHTTAASLAAHRAEAHETGAKFHTNVGNDTKEHHQQAAEHFRAAEKEHRAHAAHHSALSRPGGGGGSHTFHGNQYTKAALGPEATRVLQSEWAELSKATLRVAKAGGDEQYVLGIVLEPGVVDAQDDTYSADEVRKASERFMEQHRNMGLMHKKIVNDKVQILENYLAPVDMQIGDTLVKKGTWLMGVRVKDPELWAGVKDGTYTGFSIGGSAIRTPTSQTV